MENLAYYIIRTSLSQERMSCLPEESKEVIYMGNQAENRENIPEPNSIGRNWSTRLTSLQIC